MDVATPCFRQKDSNPLICGVHQVLLVKETVAIDGNAPHLGQVRCFVCPASRHVLPDPPADGAKPPPTKKSRSPVAEELRVHSDPTTTLLT